MNLSASTNKKLSLAVGVLTFVAAAFLLLGDTWGLLSPREADLRIHHRDYRSHQPLLLGFNRSEDY